MLGGGIPANDACFLTNIVSFIKQQQEESWYLVVSFVNPHDVYIAQHYDVEDAGYGPDDLNCIPMPLSHNCKEDLSKYTKLRAHAGMTWHLNSEDSMQAYVNFSGRRPNPLSLESTAFDRAVGRDADFLLCQSW
jgi:hypothetical protein